MVGQVVISVDFLTGLKESIFVYFLNGFTFVLDSLDNGSLRHFIETLSVESKEYPKEKKLFEVFKILNRVSL